MKRSLPALLIPLALAGCIETKHTFVIEQPKPVVVKLEVSGHFDIVIRDARENLEKITGEKPTHTVDLKDIGLAPSPSPSAEVLPGMPDEPLFLVRHSQARTPVAPTHYAAAVQDDLIAAMRARAAQIRGMWDSKLVGESADGTLSVRGTLTAEQQKLVTDENRDRAALYAAEAASKKVPLAEVIIGYYKERLGYAKAGNWYQKRNDAGVWEWKQWGM